VLFRSSILDFKIATVIQNRLSHPNISGVFDDIEIEEEGYMPGQMEQTSGHGTVWYVSFSRVNKPSASGLDPGVVHITHSDPLRTLSGAMSQMLRVYAADITGYGEEIPHGRRHCCRSSLQ
jgi:hypothetical protein